MSLSEFITGAADAGPVIGVCRTAGVTRSVAHAAATGIVVRTVDGAAARTRDGVFGEFARAWDFPDHFGHNGDAFDECMRELDDVAASTPSPAGYLTVIDHPADVLADSASDATADLAWLAQAFVFYREHYRDGATPSAVFAVLLHAVDSRDYRATLSRWRATGVEVAELS